MLQAEQLTVELDGDSGIVRAVDALALSIHRGETFALVGESGCGKSMTALALMRLLPENGRITGGRIELEGSDTLGLPESQMRSIRGGRIGMIFQEPATSLNPVVRVGDQIVEAIQTHTALRGAAARAKAIDWLGRVGIAEPEQRFDEYPFRMSGGQKQRVMIAMTLATEPDFLIADEPTTALDVTIQKQILDLLRDLQREQGLGLLLITHDLGVVAGLARRVALMYAGQIIEVAPADEFFRSPRHPYAQALLHAVPDTAHRGRPLVAIAGTVPSLSQDFSGCRFAPRCASVMAHCATTRPAQTPIGPTRSVRCLLYVPDGPVAGLHPGPLTGPGQGAPASVVKAHPRPQDRVSAPARTAPLVAGAPLLLSVQDLRVRFPIRKGLLQRTLGHFEAVAGVSFEIRPGKTLALVGESGCGKTTIGKAILQLLRGRADVDGRALLGGRNLFDLQGDALQAARREIQIIFQDPFSSLNPRMRVFDILEEGLIALHPGMDRQARRERLLRLTDQVGLPGEALDRFPHEFSGGQRQRIAIARALAPEPKLIVCDEPTSALDVSVQAQILNLLAQLQREMGLSYLFITHNLGVVEYIADQVAVMQAGRIVEQGAAEIVLQRPQHEYTRTLMAAVPRLVPAA
jgi:peptide/nickel transport system ATP-binding protein